MTSCSETQTTDEGEDHFIRVWLGVDSRQTLDLHRHPDFFPHLAHNRLPWCLTDLDTSSRKIPEIKVATVTEQHTPLVVEDDRERT